MVQVNSVGIVGGGSAGWLTALFLQKTYNQLDITVVEDELIRLNTFFEELTVGCENINFWKKLWLKQ